MKKLLLSGLTFFYTLSLTGQTDWESHWNNGLAYYEEQCYLEASKEFDQAINMMSDQELQEFPFVLSDRAENDFFLGNDLRVLEDTEKALNSNNLTDYERLNCGIKRIAILSRQGEDEAASEEYKKYIIGCPLFPKYSFSNEKIIIRNIPDCECYKNLSKQLMLSQFSTKESDIQDFGNTRIINISKDLICLPCKESQMRNQKQVQGCCNTCNKLAIASASVCGCISVPFGPITCGVCRTACLIFVEEIRQLCEWCCQNGGLGGKCWEQFETWKIDFHQKNPDCPQPPMSCP